MRARIWAIILIGAWAGAVGGCGKSEDERDEFISQLCAEMAPCCASVGRPTDGAQCRAFYGAFVGSAGYDRAAAEACLSEVRARQDACDTSSKATPSCEKVFSTTGGTKQPGEACEDDSDCARQSEGEVECVSDYADGATIRQCQLRLPGEAGSSPCVGTVDGNVTSYAGVQEGIPERGYLCDVADGLTCDGAAGACKKLPTAGEACSGDCVRGAYCAFPEGSCKERSPLGTACVDSDECVEQAFCQDGSKTCVAKLASGATCETNPQCASGSCSNQKCAELGSTDLALVFLCGTN